MIFRRSFRASAAAAALGCAAALTAQEPVPFGDYFWPTPNAAFVRGGNAESVAQPTESGATLSALFGCVRNDGRRFHEGLDLGPISRDQRGEATDPIFAFADGVVRYVNRRPSLSSYGNYVVLEHPQIAPGLVTVYAHLSAIPDRIAAGTAVRGGQRIATMGRSAGGYRIPPSRAHLHFEVGLWLGSDFQSWYDAQSFDSANDHGDFNGMNIVGLDVWELLLALRSGAADGVWEFVASEPIAVVAHVRSDRIPAALRANPHLMVNLALPPTHAGWKIELTWYGAPLRFTALAADEMPRFSGWFHSEPVNARLLKGNGCVGLARAESLARRLFP